MTVASDVARWTGVGNGSATAFPYTTKIFAKTDLQVYQAGTLKTVDTHYTVSGVGETSGGNVTFLIAPANGESIVIQKAIPNTQVESLPLGGAFPSTAVERALDRLVMLTQQVAKRATSRILRQPDSDAADIGLLPAKASRLGMFLRFNATTGDPEVVALADIDSTAVSGFINTLLDDTDAATARATLGLIIGTDVLAPSGSGASLTGIRKQGLETIWIPAGAMTPTVSNGCATLTKVETTSGRPDMVVLDFDATSDEHAQFSVTFPKSWDEGTITFQAFHTTTATDTDGVAWGLQGVAASDGDTIDVAYGTPVVATDAYQSTAEDLYVTAVSSAVTIAGTPAAGDAVFFRVFRDVSDAADTATEDARLIGIKIFFTTNAADDT